MKANAPKRKVFNDAVDMLTGGEPAAAGKGVQMLPVESIKPFHNHPFHLYEGERLDDMVESVRSMASWSRPLSARLPGDMRCWQGITV